MKGPASERFDEFFERLHGVSPYPWQRRLAEFAVEESWPGAINLPTGSGKTACLDIAVFALAYQASLPIQERTAPRRIFFCVNRRVIVDEAYQRARRMAEEIWRAETNRTGILTEVASALRSVAGAADRSVPPLDVLELRGGIYRDNRWARSITQPTIVCTTLDQLGSRLLFRGYGVSAFSAPIHAALIAYDSLVLLDEAHISEPFRQTLAAVTGYLDPGNWAEQSIDVRPVIVVPMTATPPGNLEDHQVVRLTDDDRAIAPLNARLTASKPAELREVNDVAKAAVDAACSMVVDQPAAVGIIVNRVATAREIYQALLEGRADTTKKGKTLPGDATVNLVIGSMRPIDRDRQTMILRPLVGPERPKPRSEYTSVVVATQCLEVGADYDFDVLITECASLDALRQRFGRLNRGGRSMPARALVLVNKKDIKGDERLDDDKPLDPIYGNALARTWNWLCARADTDEGDGVSIRCIDFGIDVFDELLRLHEGDAPPLRLLAPGASLDAPVMMPAYVDLWCQTAPQPLPDPDVSLFIHGPVGGEPDVQVCWRADLVEDPRMRAVEHWCDVVALLPPSSAECMRVPISRMRRWLKGQAGVDDETGDVIGERPSGVDSDGTTDRKVSRRAVLWRGSRASLALPSANDIRPGDTVVVPATADGFDVLGYLPELYQSEDVGEAHSTARDHGEDAFFLARGRPALRLHPALHDRFGDAFDDLLAAAGRLDDERLTRDQWRELLAEATDALPADHALKITVAGLVAASGLEVGQYPDGRGAVLKSRERSGSAVQWFLPPTDEGEDETSVVQREDPVFLSDHTRHLAQQVRSTLETLALDAFRGPLVRAAELHDWGKADERFQAMLRGSDRTDAWLLAGASHGQWAKSESMARSPAQRRAARLRSGLPDGFRHEMLSVQFAEHRDELADDKHGRDLVLHLIAAHHGRARPFAPVVLDQELPAVSVDDIELTHEQRARLVPPHRLDSGIAERFWRLVRRFGWWGLAYLEAMLRLADQQASEAEEAGRYRDEARSQVQEVAS